MQRSIIILLAAMLLVALGDGHGGGQAQTSAQIEDDDDDELEVSHDIAYEALKSGRIVPFSKILDWLDATYDGVVLEIELEDDKGQLIYEVEFLTARQVMVEIEFDAATGSMLRVKGTGLDQVKKAP